MENIKTKPLSELVNFVIGPFGSAFNTENYVECSEYRYIRGQDVKPIMLQDSSNRYISEEDFTRLSKYALQVNDLLVSVVGTLGNVALAREKDLPAIFSNKSTVLRTDDANLAKYIMVYMNTWFGRMDLLRNTRGAVQTGLNLEDLKKASIPEFSNNFYKKIGEIIDLGNKNIDDSKQLYRDAESKLMEFLDITDFNSLVEQPKAINVKSFSDSFGISGRLDAEYYQPKYERLIKKIKSYTRGWIQLSEVFDLVKTKINKAEESYNYIEIGDIDISSGESNFSSVDTEELPANAKVHPSKNDLLVSKVRPNRGAVSIIDKEIPRLVVSGAFSVLRENGDYTVQMLKVLLRSKIYRELLLKNNVGTSYPVIKDTDVLSLPIPLFDEKTNNEILLAVKASQRHLDFSNELLNIAKKSVELAIEKNEDVAILYVNSQLANLISKSQLENR
ncbi:restriction endonuclease subunit S [Enterococcus faecium]|nr:restriction endonuclease subunit S [Enterococcus faecium]